MAGRFTSAVVFESGPKIHEGLHTPTPEELLEKEKEEKKKEEDNISPKQHAAKMGMYGPLTRETKPWQPARLLCKRFGVKDPNPPPEMPSDAPPAGPSGSNWQQEPSDIAGQSSNAGGSNPAVGATGDAARRNGPRDLANIGLGEDEDQGRDTLTYERPTMDVFKAIFASDDEDSDDDEAKKDEDEDIGVGGNVATNPPIQADKKNGLQQGSSTLVGSTATSNTMVVDMGSFKPTFIPRGKKDKEKKEKKREKKSVLVSFEMDEEGGGVSISQPKPPKDRPKKKKRKEKEKRRDDDDDDDGMWVEKPAAEAVKDLLLPPPTPEPPSATNNSISTGLAKSRKRAIDFM
jgi:G patch domain-containing protein 1